MCLAAAVVLDKDLYVFVTGGADRVFSNKLTAATTTWSGWSEVPAGAITGGTGPASAVYRDTLYLFVLGPTEHLFVNSLSPAGWRLWSEVPGGGIGAEGLAAASCSACVDWEAGSTGIKWVRAATDSGLNSPAMGAPPTLPVRRW